MSDDYRDEKGRLKKGAPALYKGKPKQSDQPPPDQDDPSSADFDAAIIASAHSYGSGSRIKSGLAGYCANLRDTRPADFAALLSKALARKAEEQAAIGTGASGIKAVHIGQIPENCYVTMAQMQALQGVDFPTCEQLPEVLPFAQPPSRPVLVHPHTEVPAPSANEFAFGTDDDPDEAA